MEFDQLAHERYSVRKFKSTPIERDKLEKILEIGNAAPTAMNIQPQKIYVVRSTGGLVKMNHLYNPPFCERHRRVYETA